MQETNPHQAPSTTPTPTTMSHTTDFDRKLADMEARIQTQISTMSAQQDTQMKNILSKFDENVQHIMNGFQAMMANVHQLVNLPPPVLIEVPKNVNETSPHVGSLVKNNMPSPVALVNNSQADGAQH
jgi:hypothetical protein